MPISRIYDMEKLKKKLISLGGSKVAGTSNDKNMLKRAKVLESKNILIRTMIRSSCHYNSAQLVIDHSESEYKGELQMWIGWGLSSDGIWREHSWIVAKEDSELFPIKGEDGEYEETSVSSGTIIETTEPRVMYFGHPISGEEFDRIAYHQGAF